MSFSGIDVNLIRELIGEHRCFDQTYSLASIDKVTLKQSHSDTQKTLLEMVSGQEKELYERFQKNIVKELYIFEQKPVDIMKQTKKTI
jgi:hypothetical protein